MKKFNKYAITMAVFLTFNTVETFSEKAIAMEYSEQESSKDEFWLNGSIGYRLNIEGAACGSRAYSISKTLDGGLNWDMLSEDPFGGRMGVANGVAFINENLGFLSLSHSGGSYGELYRTEDGGKTFEVVDIPEVEVESFDGEKYNPFILPEVPYEEDGILYVKVGQGQYGDYSGSDDFYGRPMALFASEDNGVTWKFVKEVPEEFWG